MQVDRPFFDKFSHPSFFNNIKDVGRSVVREINNVLTARSPFWAAKGNPFSYGILDLSAFENDNKKFIDNIKTAILAADPRIAELEISNFAIDLKKQTLNFSLIFSLKNNLSDSFSTSIYVRV